MSDVMDYLDLILDKDVKTDEDGAEEVRNLVTGRLGPVIEKRGNKIIIRERDVIGDIKVMVVERQIEIQ